MGKLQLHACGLSLIGMVHRRRSQSRRIWLVNRRRFGREAHCSVIISRVTDSGTYKSIGSLKYGGGLGMADMRLVRSRLSFVNDFPGLPRQPGLRLFGLA